MSKKLIFIILLSIIFTSLNAQFKNTAYLFNNGAYVVVNGDFYASTGEFYNDSGKVIFKKDIYGLEGFDMSYLDGNNYILDNNEHHIYNNVKFFGSVIFSGDVFIHNDIIVQGGLEANDAYIYLLDSTYLEIYYPEFNNSDIFLTETASIVVGVLENETLELPLNDGINPIPMFITSNTLGINLIKVNMVNDKFDSVSSENYLNRYWKIEKLNDADFEIVFTYSDYDVYGEETALTPILFADGYSIEGDNIDYNANTMKFTDIRNGIYTASGDTPTFIPSESSDIVYAANQKIYLKLDQNSEVEVFDVLGRNVFSGKNITEKQIPVKEKGIYLIKISNEQANEVYKLAVF